MALMRSVYIINSSARTVTRRKRFKSLGIDLLGDTVLNNKILYSFIMYSKSRNVPAATPKISPVTLALQLVSGERLIAEFRPEGDRLSTC